MPNNPQRQGTATAQAPQLEQGALFGFPGVTRWTEQADINDGITTTLSQAANVPVTGLLPFRQTDIVFGWRYIQQITNTEADGTDTVATSAYFPYNFGGPFQLNITNLYNLIDVQSMFDIATLNFIRPMIGFDQRGKAGLMTAPQAFPYNPQANLVTAGNYTRASTPLNIEYDIPASIWFDEYVELDANANIIGVAHRVPVSPLYMSGTAREVYPQATMNAAVGASFDTSPYVVTTVGGGAHISFSGSVLHKWQRLGIYGTKNPPEMPTVFNWRYAYVSRRVAVNGQQTLTIPLKSVINNGGGGQVLSISARLFDPAVGTGGAVVNVNTLASTRLLYGSSLVRFQDNIFPFHQARIIDQHDVLLPGGMVLYDLARDYNGKITNATALNAYTTDISLELNFTSAPTTTAYAVVAVEYLTYVIDQPVLS